MTVSINTVNMEMVGFEPTSTGVSAGALPLSYIPRV